MSFDCRIILRELLFLVWVRSFEGSIPFGIMSFGMTILILLLSKLSVLSVMANGIMSNDHYAKYHYAKRHYRVIGLSLRYKPILERQLSDFFLNTPFSKGIVGKKQVNCYDLVCDHWSAGPGDIVAYPGLPESTG